MNVLLLALVSTQLAPSDPVSLPSLLKEMASLDSVARLPKPSFKLLQSSSYDRAQTSIKEQSTWYANGDSGQFLRTETRDGKTEWVIQEHAGPGVITRFWIPLLAEKEQTVIRFYFDGSETPAIETNFHALMRGEGFAKPPFAFVAWPEPGLKATVAADLYFPIPYAKGCKITLSESPFYYVINYRAYEPGTRVKTFAMTDVDASRTRLAATAKSLTAFSALPAIARKPLGPGAAREFLLPAGANAVSDVSVSLAPGSDPQVLRSVVIEATFDGEKTIWCPIGEFFGAGVSGEPVWDRYRTVLKSGQMQSRWTMPYRSKAKFRLLNLGKESVSIGALVKTKPWSWDDRSMLFHANWRHQYPVATRPMSDWNYIEVKGKGVYVGDSLTVMSPSPAWYGEGDERIYVDGETFPSHQGTGTEDYYGYAWGMAERFSSPFIAMPQRSHMGRDDWTGFTTTSRVRMLDGIPFSRSLKFDMEVWHWAECLTEYSAATMWYAKPGASSNRSPAPLEAAKPLPEWRFLIKGAMECETAPVVRQAPSLTISAQGAGLSGGAWSEGKQLFVQANTVGDFIELRFNVKKPGKHRITLYGTKSFDYGTLRLSVNGKPSGDVDLWSANAVASGAVDLGVHDLPNGSLILRAEVIGTNSNSRGPRFYFGLDCLVATPSK